MGGASFVGRVAIVVTAVLAFAAVVLTGCGSAGEVATDDGARARAPAEETTGATISSAPAASLAETLGGGPCEWPTEEPSGPMAALTLATSWYRTTAGELGEALAQGRPSRLDPLLGTVVAVADFELVSRSGGEPFVGVSVTDDVAPRLAEVDADETVLLGVGMIGDAIAVAVVRPDGEAAFVGDCALEMGTWRLERFAQYLQLAPAEVLEQAAAGRDFQEEINEFVLEGVRPVPWEERDPSERQLALGEVPMEILESLAGVRLRIAVPAAWEGEAFVVCTKVPMAWNACASMQAANPEGILTLNAFFDPSGSDDLEFWVFESSPSWSTADGRLLGRVATADFVDEHYVDVMLDVEVTGDELFATPPGSEVDATIRTSDGGPFAGG